MLQRLLYLDLLRGFAVFAMILQHGHIYHGNREHWFTQAMLALGTAPAAPIFMLAMGVFAMRSKKTKLKQLWRGIILIILGYVLNIIRYVIPLGLPDLFFIVGILQLAGLSLIVLTYLKPLLTVHPIAPLLLAIGVFFIHFFYTWGTEPPLLITPFYGHNTLVHFPLIPWLAYPLLGASLAHIAEDARTIKRVLPIIGSITLVIASVWHVLGGYEIGTYADISTTAHVGIMAFACFWTTLAVVITERVPASHKMIRIVSSWGRHVTSMFFVQWVFYAFALAYFLGANSAVFGLFLSLTILIFTHLIVVTFGGWKLFRWV